MLASAQVRLEFARPVVYRAAFSVARAAETRAVDVSHAKAAAADAAVHAARAALQVHGAIGYTWEADLHFWMKRAWALEAAWGSRTWHRARVGAAILDGVGHAASFGYSPRDMAR
jgi:alkylation response protein AidB-like acyl-CoA dehydrogenase